MLKIKIIVGILIFFFLSSCKEKEISSNSNHDKLSKYINKVQKYKIKKRIKVWDSLMHDSQLNDSDLAMLYFYKGNDLNISSNYSEAFDLYKKALEIYQEMNNERMIAKVYINLGITSSYINDKGVAIDYVLKAYEMAKRLDDTEIISRSFGELAHIYHQFGDIDKSIEYYKKAIELDKQNQDNFSLARVYHNLSVLFFEKEDYQKALDYAQKSQQLKYNLNDDLLIIYGYDNLFRIFLKLNDYKTASEYNRKALKLMKENNLELPDIYESTSDYYAAINNIDSAEYYISKALSNKVEYISDKIGYYKKLLMIKLKKNDAKSAIELVKIKDSLIKIYEEQNQFKSRRAIENSILYITNRNQLQQAKQLNKKNRIIFIFIIVVFLLGILISFQLNRLDKLKYMQEKYVLEQKILRSQMNPHFIFNVLSSIQSTLIENNPIKSATYLSKFAQLIRQNFDFVQKSWIFLKDELSMIKNYLETQKFRYKDKFDYEIVVDESIEQSKIKIPPMILQPFVENAIEHGFKNIDNKGLLKIVITNNDNKICFEIIDNGKGFQENKKDDKEHALDIFRRRLEILGKEEIDSFKIVLLEQGTKFVFCLTKKH